MVEHFDEFVLLLLRSDGKNAAVSAFEEENGVSHMEAVQAIEELARRHGVHLRLQSAKRWAAIVASIVAAGILGFMILAR